VHAPVSTMTDDLARVMRDAIARGGKIVVPSFAVGRTQELLYVLRQLRDEDRLPPMPVFIDSPLAIDATGVFRGHPECFDAATRERLERDGDIFHVDGLSFARTREESIAINDVRGPAMIIAGSGMAEGGRVLHHLRNLVEDPRTTVLVVGFMAQHTLGRRLVERPPQVRIWGVERELNARVEVLNAFSAHADRDDLAAHAQACAPRRVFLVHGEPPAQAALAARLADAGLTVSIPSRGETFDLE
jgi:metallo-beta-lactamase family protein